MKGRNEIHSSASSTFGARSRFTAPEVSGAGVAVVVADSLTGAEEGASSDFLDDFFFFLVCIER